MIATLPRRAARSAAAAPLPTPGQLAALGTVLCLYRGRAGGELAGWAQAAHVEVRAAVDSDGMHECLCFRDAGGDCCWKLFLLPDSDLLAWERLCTGLPAAAAVQPPAASVAERLLQRLASRIGGDWQASVLQLHARPAHGSSAGHPVLAASLAAVSPLGAALSRRIARQQGAVGESLSDDCCCERAAKAATAAQRMPGAAHRHDDGLDPPITITLTRR